MAAAYGTMLFKGKSGRTYNISIYLDDTPNNPVRFSSAGKAGSTSATEYVPPEPVALEDMTLASDAAAIEYVQIMRNGVPTGDLINVPGSVVTNNYRPQFRIPFNPVQKLQAIELA